ncbi:hypothetical protein N0V90_010850 [Kalmusia sp. IMI 367209]|nr:hypothetical protein N0V90_010850 [Kalmusia sp. IMI 367209]
MLTITHLSSPLPNVGTCVGQLRSIIDQCLTTGGNHGGISQTPEALYEVSAVEDDWANFEQLDGRSEEEDWSDEDEDDDDELELHIWSESDQWAEKRALEEERYANGSGGDDDEDNEKEHKFSSLEVRGSGSGKTAKTGKTRVKAKTGKTRVKARPGTKSTTKKKNKTKKSTNKNKKGKNKESKSCPLPKKKTGTTGKTGRTGKKKTGTKSIRDIVEDYLPEVMSNAILPRGNGQSTGRKKKGKTKSTGKTKSKGAGKPKPKNCAMDQWYQEIELLDNDRATWWSFNTKSGWKEGVTDPDAKTILAKMRSLGKFDVIEVTSAFMAVEGNAHGGTSPNSYAGHRGSYLLSNGGFFNMKTFAPVGKTSVSDTFDPIPKAYADDYVEIEGEDGFLHSGPDLMGGAISFSGDKWKYHKSNGAKTKYAEMVGSLAHASQPNERLALVTLYNYNKYLFVYTAEKRENGLNVRGLKDLIGLWFQTYTTVHPTEITQGSIKDEFPAAPAKRTVANVIRLFHSAQRTAALPEEEEETPAT